MRWAIAISGSRSRNLIRFDAGVASAAGSGSRAGKMRKLRRSMVTSVRPPVIWTYNRYRLPKRAFINQTPALYNVRKDLFPGRSRMSMRISVLGSGAWGTTVAMLLARKPQHRVCLWSYRPELTHELQATRENTRVLPGVRIPEAIRFESDIAAATHAVDLCVAAVPTVYLRATLSTARPKLREATPVVSLCKGVENGTFARPTEILRELLGVKRLAVLSGPSHAEEVARGLPASVVAASVDAELAKLVQDCTGSEHFRVYTNADMIGVELAGAAEKRHRHCRRYL